MCVQKTKITRYFYKIMTVYKLLTVHAHTLYLDIRYGRFHRYIRDIPPVGRRCEDAYKICLALIILMTDVDEILQYFKILSQTGIFRDSLLPILIIRKTTCHYELKSLLNISWEYKSRAPLKKYFTIEYENYVMQAASFHY